MATTIPHRPASHEIALRTAQDILRTTIFRQISLYFVAFVSFIAVVFGIIYWQAETYEVDQVDRFLEERLVVLEATDVDGMLKALARDRNAADVQAASFGLFALNGHRVAGDLDSLPASLPLDGHTHALGSSGPAESSGSGLYAAGTRLPDGRILVIQRDLRQMADLRNAVLMALFAGIVPTLLLSIVIGLALGYRTLRRARTLHNTVERIMRGNLRGRLPKTPADDDFDRLADSINRMLDLMGTLLDQIRGVGDDIAHDLRTPLTRVRTRLERGSRMARSKVELEQTVDAALGGLDQAIAITTSLLRITEIEDGRRRAAFTTIELPEMARDLFELYEPIAEARMVALRLDAATTPPIWGDRDLLMEAMSNIVDNAIKFTPDPGSVVIATLSDPRGTIFRVSDSGSGIPAPEREAVMRRFYRTDKSRHLPGTGLGLGLVAAITKLHAFEVEIGGDQSGCVFEIVCHDRRDESVIVD